MRLFFLMLLFVCTTYCKKESLVGLEDLFDDPDLLFELKKRLGNILDSDYPVESAEDVDCLAASGLIESDCKFHSNKTTIIKTKESLARGATFLADFSNITCARDCTAKCCENPECDTVVYQNKEDHNCYLFKCEESSLCVFAEHSNYLMSSISKAAHASHSFTPGGATYSHENELQNLGSHDTKTDTVLPTTTQLVPKPAKQKPGLADFCESYESECADPHAECLMKECTCRVGYHEKHKTCRKHCREDEFECEQYRPEERQCVHKDYVCDRTNDCMDGSDEYGCPEKDKTAYLDSDSSRNLFNNPLYHTPYNNQPDNQYPFGFPIPGLTNQQQAGLLQSANQLYPGQIQAANGNAGQIPANGNTGGQYYLSGLSNQNQGNVNIPQTGSQLNGQWPFIDRNVGMASQVYQNNLPYQTGQQQNVAQQPIIGQNVAPVSNYAPAQTGYVPVVQNPVQPVQPVNQNQQPAQQNPQLNNAPNVQQPALSNHMSNPGIKQINTGTQKTLSNTAYQNPINLDNSPSESVITKEKGQDQSKMNKQVYETTTERDKVKQNDAKLTNDFGSGHNDGNINRVEDGYYDNDRNHDVNKLPIKSDEKSSSLSGYDNAKSESRNNKDHTNSNIDTDEDVQGHFSEDKEENNEKTRTYPTAIKVKQQIETPTQSTVPGQKQGHSQSNSEGFPDYFSSWMQFENDSPKVSGKKGKNLSPSQGKQDKPETSPQSNKPAVKTDNSKVSVTKQNKEKPAADVVASNQFDDSVNKGRYDEDNDDAGYRNQYPDRYDNRRPGGNNNRRPSYDNYNDRFGDARHRPSHGSRYPYYDSGYQRGRDRYPAWDPFREEYYYPNEDFDDHRFPVDNSHELDYDNYRPGDRPSQTRPYNDKDTKVGVKTKPQGDKPVVTEPPTKTLPPTEPSKVIVPETVKPTAVKPTEAPDVPKTDETVDESQTPTDTDQTDTDTDKSVDTEPVNSESTADQSTDDKDSKISNISSTDSSGKAKDAGSYNFLNVDNVEVESFTDSSQGPVVALALGLAITMMLLIFVGCRLRTVKRRLRKGRTLHSNEADYLINGMYL